ncbi:MAG: ACT domain-containing protein [Pseudomonadota bacterium]
MVGETNLERLLKSMQPTLIEGEFVFISIANATYGDLSHLQPIAMFCEEEGMTLVVPKASAEKAGLPYESVFKCITLKIHSSLDAVGLTAAFSNRLASEGISANVFAGYYHDHIFVQQDNAEKALQALQSMVGN